ncbi:hypothetical protein EVAR_26534_1 [Eumeta japonica]|uniref:Uncharacterized protein n=1 Tax=Eumeta variegata TaxID=151549 RepID=A0A4C1YSV0_EUMVA|nr:hypothetical protein EVAR_26534_1 [Eumeta japonica]
MRWMAPISLAIHAPGRDLGPTVDSIRYLRDCLGSDLVRQFVTFHVFFSNKHIPSSIPKPEGFLSLPYNCSLGPPYVVNASATYMKEKDLLYPVNVARNVARDAALTHFILPSDIELYPSPNLVPKFLNMIARNAKPLNTSTNPRVFPISIFEVDAKVQKSSLMCVYKANSSKRILAGYGALCERVTVDDTCCRVVAVFRLVISGLDRNYITVLLNVKGYRY